MLTPEEILAEKLAELAQVKAAIAAAYSGAEYTIQDGQTRRHVRRQDLKTLLARRSELETEITRTQGGGVSFGMPVDSPRGFTY